MHVSLTFKSWMDLLGKDSLSGPDKTMILKGLQDHPEWVNQPDQRQQTPLIRASSYHHLEMVNALILAGADLNLQDQDGGSALMCAADYGHPILIQSLILAGADLNLQDQRGFTALIRAMRASYRGRTDVAQILIQLGADLNLQDHEGWTALMHAAWQVNLNVVQFLIQHGADPHVLNRHQKTALDLALQSGDDQLIRLLEAYSTRHALNRLVQPLESSVPDHPLHETPPLSPSSTKTPRL